MLGKLHHIELHVHDLEKSTTFWAWLLEKLGYNPFQKWHNGISGKQDGIEICLVQTPSDHLEPAYHRRRTGLNHVAFYGGTRQQVDQLRTELKNRQVTLLYENEYPYAGGPDYYALFFEDPNRIKLEVVAVD